MDNEKLKETIVRLEAIYKDIDVLKNDAKGVLMLAKAQGFDPKYIREILKLRKLDPDELDEQDELTHMYRNAVGL